MAKTESTELSTRHSFFRFALVGAAGFLVDAGALTLALSLGADFYTGRVFSFFCAVTATWYMNRVYTFGSQDRRLLHEWGRFVSANSVGGLINYATYALLVSTIGLFSSHPISAVGVGSVAGLLWNFTVSNKLVFAKQQIRQKSDKNYPEQVWKRGSTVRTSQKKINKEGAAWLVFVACSLLCFVIGHYLGVFSNGFSNSDESSHFVNSYFIWEYLREGQFTNPMAFAEQFYIAYPKLSLGHWPPLYYTLVGALFLLFPAVPETVVWMNLFVTALAGLLIALLLRPTVGFGWSLVSALAFTLLPLSMETLNFFMLDQPLTVVVLLAAWVWWRFSYRPTYAQGLLYGLLAAVAILIKGNGWLLGLFPMFHILFARRWGLLRDPRIYVGVLLCLLAVVPWYMVTAKISADGFNYSFGINYAINALTQNLLTLYHNVGIFGVGLALFALMRLWSAGGGRKEWTALVHIAASMIAAVLLLQSLVPVDIVSRYMMPAIPFLLMLAIQGIVEMEHLVYFEQRTVLLRGAQAVAVLLLLLPGLMNLVAATPQADLRMADAAATVVDPQHVQIVIIDGSSAGEGAFIAEALVASKASDLYVVRSSKILSESNFMGANYRLLVKTPAEVGAILRNLGANHIVVERREGGTRFPHNSLLEQFLADPDSGYRKQATLEHQWRPGLTHIYVAKRMFDANLHAVQEANFPKKRPHFDSERWYPRSADVAYPDLHISL